MGFLNEAYIKIAAFIGVILTGIVTILSFRSKWINDGEDKVNIKATEEALDRSIKSKEVENEVKQMPSDDLDAEYDSIVRSMSKKD